LLCEEDPQVRSGSYPSLEDAIRAFDQDFEGEALSPVADVDRPAGEVVSELISKTVAEVGVEMAAKTLGISKTTVLRHIGRRKDATIHRRSKGALK